MFGLALTPRQYYVPMLWLVSNRPAYYVLVYRRLDLILAIETFRETPEATNSGPDLRNVYRRQLIRLGSCHLSVP